MLARLKGMLHPRRTLVLLVVFLAGVTTASATWHLPGAGAGAAKASIDFHAPSVTGSTIAPQGATAAAGVAMASHGTVGWVRRSGSYTVYANAADAGSPASGVATVTANVSNLTPGTTSLSLPTCTSSCSVGGVAYGFKSAATTAGSAIV